MNLSFPCVAATIVKSTITAMRPHGGRRLVLSRQGRPESYGSKLTRYRLLHNDGPRASPSAPLLGPSPAQIPGILFPMRWSAPAGSPAKAARL